MKREVHPQRDKDKSDISELLRITGEKNED
jgi:hypothetical protein